MNLLHEAEARQTDYAAIKEQCYFNRFDTREVDISVIIPVHGRLEFNRVLTNHFIEAIVYKQNEKKVSITFVEHSEEATHKELCNETLCVNYIHIPQNKHPFNKCLCHNIGALYSNRASYYLFHDIDIMVPENFFAYLDTNMLAATKMRTNLPHEIIQTFNGRRLLYCGEKLSADIINGRANINDLNKDSDGLYIGGWGAQGGSIMVSADGFFNIGGFDADFFTEYSLEDRFFFDKAEFIFGFVVSCDSPPIELFHLHHPPAFNRIVKTECRYVIDSWLTLSDADKQKFIKIKSNQLKKHRIL